MNAKANARALYPEEREQVKQILERLQAIDKANNDTKQFEGAGGWVFVAGLEKFGLIFNEDQGLKAMLNFILWAEAYGTPADEIINTILHDVHGRNERCFDPRTSSYKDVTPEEIEALRLKKEG